MKSAIQGVVVVLFCVAGCTHFTVDPKEYLLNDGGEVKTYRVVGFELRDAFNLAFRWFLVEVPARSDLLEGAWKWDDWRRSEPDGTIDMAETFRWNEGAYRIAPGNVYWNISLRPRIVAVAAARPTDESQGSFVTREDLDVSVKAIRILDSRPPRIMLLSPPRTIRELFKEQPWTEGEAQNGSPQP